MKKRVVIVGGVRTPVTNYRGSFKDTPAVDLLTVVFKEAIRRSGIDPKAIDDTIAGCCIQTSDAPDIARVAALKAGVPVEVPGFTVQRNCASGIQSITSAYQQIQAGDGDVYLVGGVDSMSSAPHQLRNHRFGIHRGHDQLTDVVWEGLRDPIARHLMGTCCEKIAEKYGITADEQDEFAAHSHQKALKAQRERRFKDQIVPVTINVPGKGEETTYNDETIRVNFSKEQVAAARDMAAANVFSEKALLRDGKITEEIERIFCLAGEDTQKRVKEIIVELQNLADRGTVTGANACAMSDGAAAMIVMTEKKAQEMGVTPQAYVVSYGYAGVDPVYFGLGPVKAVPLALKKAGLKIEDIDFFEINEAFAAQVLACKKELKIPDEKFNIWGGAIALGHPIGATGAILTVKLIHILKEHNRKYGLTSMCVGGGQGGALIIKNYQA